MAWVRTSLSLLSFGFTIYKVLEGFVSEGRGLAPTLPRNAGLTLAFAGTLAMVLGIAEYISTQRRLGSMHTATVKRFTLLMAVLMCLTGIALFLGIATHII